MQRKLNNLYFVRMRNAQWAQIVYVLTAKNEEEAKQLGLAGVAANCREEYSYNVHCELICTTPETVVQFEPV